MHQEDSPSCAFLRILERKRSDSGGPRVSRGAQLVLHFLDVGFIMDSRFNHPAQLRAGLQNFQNVQTDIIGRDLRQKAARAAIGHCQPAFAIQNHDPDFKAVQDLIKQGSGALTRD